MNSENPLKQCVLEHSSLECKAKKENVKMVQNAAWRINAAEGAKDILMHYSSSHAALSREVRIEVNRIRSSWFFLLPATKRKVRTLSLRVKQI